MQMSVVGASLSSGSAMSGWGVSDQHHALIAGARNRKDTITVAAQKAMKASVQARFVPAHYELGIGRVSLDVPTI